MRSSTPPLSLFGALIRRWHANDLWRIAAVGACLLAIPLAIKMGRGPGMTADDLVQRLYGDLILAWYQSGFSDRGALSFINLYLYGGLFDLPAQWLISSGLLPWERYEARHVLSALVAVGGMVATWLSANRIAGPRAGLAAAAMLALTPSWVGHGLFNSKDIPFGTTSAFVMYASVRIALRGAALGWGDALWAAAALGCTLGVRSGGMFMIVYLFLALSLRLVLNGRRAVARNAARAFGRLLAALPLAWLIMLSAWPWAQLAPFTRPFAAASEAAHFDHPGKMRFDGAIISTSQIPANYLVRWFQVTLPDLYALALVCGVIALVGAALRRGCDRSRASAIGMLVILVVAPLVGFSMVRPVVYDGPRHFLFILPPLAALAGLAIEHVLCDARLHLALRSCVGALALGLAALTVHDMVALHPYEYVYFNRASGGLAAQAARFETDHQSASYREGFAWVVHHYDPGGTRRIEIGTCAADKQIAYYRKLWNAGRFVPARNKHTPEVFLATTKRDCHKRAGELIHTVDRQGVPLLYVFHLER